MRSLHHRNEPEWLKDYRTRIRCLSMIVSQLRCLLLYNKYTDAKKMDPEKVSLSVSTTETIPSFLEKRLSELENETLYYSNWNKHPQNQYF